MLTEEAYDDHQRVTGWCFFTLSLSRCFARCMAVFADP
jgi:hypothetical protein